MPDRVRVTEGQMRLMLFAVEHGYRQCEKGHNLQAALASVHAMYRCQDDDEETSRVPGSRRSRGLPPVRDHADKPPQQEKT